MRILKLSALLLLAWVLLSSAIFLAIYTASCVVGIPGQSITINLNTTGADAGSGSRDGINEEGGY